MDSQSDSLLKKIEDLLSMEIGDIARLEHIKKTIINNKKLYNSDIQYVNDLEKNNPRLTQDDKENYLNALDNTCWNCKKELESNGRFCSTCGADQLQKGSDFTELLSRRKKIEYNPLKIISNLHTYQILAVIGGLCALVPIIIALQSLERIFEIIEFYTNRDFSGLFGGFMSLGIISSVWSFLVMIIPFLVKKPKKVGKFLFFSSFGILICSMITGVVGFVIILFAGILAVKKRRY